MQSIYCISLYDCWFKQSIDSNGASCQEHENNRLSCFYHIILLCSTKNILEKALHTGLL